MPSSSTISEPSPRPPQEYCLPAGYRQRSRNQTLDANREDGPYWSPWRIAESARYQHHVYAWAARLIRERGLGRVLDLGCGVGTKMAIHLIPHAREVEGMDQAAALEVARARGIGVPLAAVDLERPGPMSSRPFDLIVCADVVEHLLDPDPMLGLIRSLSHAGTRLLISTPERDRERGRDCRGADKPEHVREWSRGEFRAFLESRGLRPRACRLLPKADAEIPPLREQERRFRLRLSDRSPLCCQAWLCAVERPGAGA